MHFLVWLLLFTIIAGILTCFVGFYVDYRTTTRRIRELRFLLQHPRPNPNPYSYLYRHNIPIQVITDRNHNIAWFRKTDVSSATGILRKRFNSFGIFDPCSYLLSGPYGLNFFIFWEYRIKTDNLIGADNIEYLP